MIITSKLTRLEKLENGLEGIQLDIDNYELQYHDWINKPDQRQGAMDALSTWYELRDLVKKAIKREEKKTIK